MCEQVDMMRMNIHMRYSTTKDVVLRIYEARITKVLVV
jgi:hypothetical protein